MIFLWNGEGHFVCLVFHKSTVKIHVQTIIVCWHSVNTILLCCFIIQIFINLRLFLLPLLWIIRNAEMPAAHLSCSGFQWWSTVLVMMSWNETLSALLVLCEGNPTVTGEFPSYKGQQCEGLVLSLLLIWISGWTNNWVVNGFRSYKTHLHFNEYHWGKT